MTLHTTLDEFRGSWLPHVTDAGLFRIAELLEQGSPLLIHGAFSRACAMGCLATHIAWHHPRTQELTDDAGVCWLTRVAELNPATSQVILAWDRAGSADWELRAGLVRACREELIRRNNSDKMTAPSDVYSGSSGASRTRLASVCDAT